MIESDWENGGREAGAHASAAARSELAEFVNCSARTAATRGSFRERFGIAAEVDSVEETLLHILASYDPNGGCR